ncbi:uncharacterized protein MELLADRAFT_91437 [Melampsora larici-populina 98AG31]|uniref:CxC1-like cysteine cluster associated with KDZ transposases domain-containing protein n=1 Tax=Melampsora larici-populina (strain 98AG31 / pathotype 3-4-7) TaxID=747676 RepID=F4RZ21_MELLP|nr:uncharacterized protein MELLADRAFT_91437 [Melampsora larici-populina 98AG31]EGG02341.1 hypothetical protein MELLADRAFT_91437 [Melampsora larici-populina 98AG31]
MVLPGEEIKNRIKSTKSKPRNQGVASQRLADAQKREELAAEAALLRLRQPPLNAAEVNAQPVDQEQPPSPDRYKAFQRADEFESDDDPPDPPPANAKEYYRGATYQERTLREEAAWRLVIPKLFAAFMPCRKDTYQWGHPTLWNHDWNQPCQCREWEKEEILVDAIDLTVRLVRMGYIGGSPSRPRTAFSCRMLRYHHTLWKYTSVRLTPFAEALDKFLDACNVLLLVRDSNQARDWRKRLSAAVDAYREMIRLEDRLATRALQLSPIEELASNFPSCFGPTVPGARDDEPNHYICLDANFQQRRHLSASASWRGETGVLPSLFISPAEVSVWKEKMAPPAQQPNRGNPNQPANDVIVSTDICTHSFWKIYLLYL